MDSLRVNLPPFQRALEILLDAKNWGVARVCPTHKICSLSKGRKLKYFSVLLLKHFSRVLSSVEDQKTSHADTIKATRRVADAITIDQASIKSSYRTWIERVEFINPYMTNNDELIWVLTMQCLWKLSGRSGSFKRRTQMMIRVRIKEILTGYEQIVPESRIGK